MDHSCIINNNHRSATFFITIDFCRGTLHGALVRVLYFVKYPFPLVLIVLRIKYHYTCVHYNLNTTTSVCNETLYYATNKNLMP